MKFIYAFLILAIPLACGGNSTDSNIAVADNFEFVEESVDYVVQMPTKQAPRNIEQKLIKESYLRFESKNLDDTYKKLASIISASDGYIQEDNASKGYNELSRRLVVRMPTTNFQKSIDAISEDVTFFDQKQISSRDVTEEFIDLEARLKAKRSLENRYIELLSKAKNVKEILEIERELSQIREDIEAKQGRLNYLKNKVSLSTLTIEFYVRTSNDGVTVSYGSKMWNAIKSGFNGLSLFFLGILHVWPFIILLAVAFFLLRRYIRKSKQKK